MNKKYYIKTVTLLTLSLFSVLLFACATNDVSNTNFDEDQQSYNPNVSFNILSQGQYSNISLANQFVIRSKRDWERSWEIHNRGKATKAPYVNFDNDFVIAIFAGQQPSGGYAVGISNITRKENNIIITVTFTEPKRNEDVSLALTQPYIFISTQKVEGKVIFVAGRQ